MRIDENERWLLSYYRHCELGGALFFGRLSRVVRPGPLQLEMTRQFADEARHADLARDLAGRNPDRRPGGHRAGQVPGAGADASS